MGKQYYIDFFDGIELKRFCEMFALKYDYIRQILKDPKRTLTEKQEVDLLEAIDKFIKDKENKRNSYKVIRNA
ncbi:hypothetical protein ACFQO9_04485 [Chryseobacterium zhengzhouense]|uniref:XRE family transcriptional regulator n=1 Tax=Chryseobacterium zhengzhouense TaxID=1636086 RepID=A0ABW2LTU0_9FLAO